ncbi:uncharacterized protein LOC129570859 [Sitodiplosis mosellana]|uniref:uncharacterized protein LOC129570859 n=1 Tax=Sitodiplosis mosellana TaxID=263140 RepID=UPI002444F19B|nr:uncharacterized protein LOC129570859 [Sitodiplosis mosellana]XP_055306559.1 uncharacterized protein LOC129570859 [Sitodiplosis mosellana]
MGVRGLKTFLEREGEIYPIDIGDEIKQWKRENPNKTPTVVIDFLSLTHCVARKENDTICSGRHQITIKAWTELLDALKATGCLLVFFADLTLQDGKSDTWLSRRNEKFDLYTSLYELIDAGVGVETIVATVQERKGLTTKFHGMELVAQTYGDFHHSIKYECDLEIAQYAKNHDVLAVMTNDTDFLIFDGPWKLWSSNDIEITASKQVKTVEYNRKALAKICSLSQRQLPILATLLGNDFTNEYYDQLNSFHRTLGPMRNKFKNVANYVRGFGSGQLSDAHITQIKQKIFGYGNDAKQQLIRQSIESYSTDFPVATVDDPIEKQLLTTSMYRPYMTMMSTNQGITMPFYDMRGCATGANFPLLLADWLKRKIGVIRQRNDDKEFSFTLLMKKAIDVFYKAYTETPIYPKFTVSPLDQLYAKANDDSDILEMRWKILAFIMTLPDDIILAIKKLSKDLTLVCVTLYALVKSGLIGENEADGILYTEHKVYANEILDAAYPTVLTAKHVRAAHLYNVAFSYVRQNFAIAGLLQSVQEIFQFDGVFYQDLMRKADKMNDPKLESLFAPIKDYRLYSKNI